MTQEWIDSLGEQFDSCENIEQLMNASADLYAFRLARGVYVEGVGMWRRRAMVLAPGFSNLSVATIDLPAIHHAAFSVKKGPSGVPELCYKMIKNIRRELNPDVVIVATDCRGGIKKFSNFSDYKADRGDRKDGFDDCLSETIETLRSLGMHVCEVNGMEADDVMCTVSYRARLLGQRVTIVTSDRDLWQALGRGVTIMNPKTKDFSNEDWLLEKHKIKPDQAVDWMCLVGKNNIPGASDIGPVTASKWLSAWGNFSGIVMMASTLREKERDSLMELAGRYGRVRDLHTLSREVSVTWSP